jgi:uncharacterized protein HemX
MEEPSALKAAGEPVPPRQTLSQRLNRPFVLVVALLALALAWHWYDSHAQIGSLREEVARRLRDSDADSRDARLLARQAQESAREAQAKLSQFEGKMVESQNQQVALEALYQELSRGRDEWVLAEVEQILAIAAQQLQLAGNVQAALAAMQTAEARLARSDRPQFIPLRKTLARDIERLKATPNLDLAGLALRLDQVIAQIDSLPLADESHAGASTPPAGAPPGDEGFWTRLGAELWGELRQLVRVRNMERTEPGLLSPTQMFFLRENLKLRLLNARLALLARDEGIFREDIKAAQAWVNRYFDVRAKPAVAALANLKQLAASGISLELPGIGDSLAAVRNYKVSREKARR